VQRIENEAKTVRSEGRALEILRLGAGSGLAWWLARIPEPTFKASRCHMSRSGWWIKGIIAGSTMLLLMIGI
nr:hypothetical protein [Tanacetum cinerariifolium]